MGTKSNFLFWERCGKKDKLPGVLFCIRTHRPPGINVKALGIAGLKM